MRLTATIRVDIVTTTPEAADFLLKTVTRDVGGGWYHCALVGRKKRGQQQVARIERASITRIRPARSKSKAQRKR